MGPHDKKSNGFDPDDKTPVERPKRKPRTIKQLVPPPVPVIEEPEVVHVMAIEAQPEPEPQFEPEEVRNPSEAPQVKSAKVWQATIQSAVATTVVGVVAFLNKWDSDTTLMAMGAAATGVFALGNMGKKK